MAVTATTSTLGTSSTGALTSPGIGSGLDVNTIVSKLMSVEQQPLTLLDKKQASYQTNLSAYGTLSSLFGAFQGAMQNLSNASAFQGITASTADPSIFTATAAKTAAPGTYTVSVTNIAQAQVQAAAGIASAQATSSTGTLTIQVGAGAAKNVTLDASNNTLEGLRDTINAADAGVNATIINDGSTTPYKLVLTSSASGAANTIQITNNLSAGELHDTVASLAEVRQGKDASLNVNGVAVKSASNSVTTVIPGVTLNLIKAGDTTLSVTRDTSAVQGAVNQFVNAYNNVNDTITKLTAYDATTKTGGPLLGDSLAQNLQTRIRSILSNAVTGTGGTLTTLSQIGVAFQKDGSLAIDGTKLSKALTNNFSDIAALFSVQGKSNNSLLTFVSAGSKAVAGDYQVNITAVATQGAATAGSAPAGSTVIDGSNDGFSLTIDGTASGAVTLAHGTYTPAQLATALQTAINGSTALTNAGASVAVTLNAGNLVLSSKSYGTSSTVATLAGTGLPALGYAGTENGTGTDVAGNFTGNGTTYAASGAGQLLTAAAGSGADSLKILYTGTPAQAVTNGTATLNYAQGYASTLAKFSNDILDPSSGSISGRTAGINASIADIGNQRDALNLRLTQIEANYRAQFTALDTMISSLNQTSSFLTQQLANLPTISSSK